MFCHGRFGSTLATPDLGNVSQIGPDGFRAIVLGGALNTRGMPSFAGKLTEDDLKALYEYISHGAHNKAGEVEHFY